MTKIKKSNQNTKFKFKNVIVNLLNDVLHVQKEELWDLIQTPKSQTHGQFTLPIPRLLKLFPQQDKEGICNEIVRLFEPDTHIESVTTQGQFLNFNVNKEEYIKETLSCVFKENKKYGQITNDQSVLIDFGNIRRGCHLRGIILGGFIQRIYEANGYKCIALNDMQADINQRDLLAVGCETLEEDPTRHSSGTCSKTSQNMKQNLGETSRQASDCFKKDKRDKEEYRRLGVCFDHVLNQPETCIPRVYQIMEEKGLCEAAEDGSLVIHLSRYDSRLGKAVVRNANGTSLQLTRDIASVLMRHETLECVNKIVYVAAVDQEHHFRQLFKIVNLMFEDVLSFPELVYVAFGKILDISTAPLKEVLDMAKENMLKVIKDDMKHGKYTDILKEGVSINGSHIEGEEAVDYIADTLGTSTLIIQSMAVKRIRDHNLVWNRMTDARGDTGIFLQYTHARVCGIERKLNIPVSIHCDFSLLYEPEAFELTRTISLYPDIIQTAFQTLDSSTIVLYLFKLAHMISQVNYNLRIKDVDPSLAEARLLLFWAAKTTLANGMKLIGLQPLERM